MTHAPVLTTRPGSLHTALLDLAHNGSYTQIASCVQKSMRMPCNRHGSCSKSSLVVVERTVQIRVNQIDCLTLGAYNPAMNPFVRKLLVLCCGGLLVLPSGWCSNVPAFNADTQKSARACCDLCHCIKHEAPVEKTPKPVPPTKCCCYEKDSLKPPTPDRFDVHFTFLGFVPPAEHSLCARGSVQELQITVPVRFRRLHLLECVWLC